MNQERELHEMKMQNERESQEFRTKEHELKMKCLEKMIDAIEVVLNFQLNDCCGINIKGNIGNFHFHKGNNIVFQNYFNDIMAYLELDHHQFPEISTLYNLTVSVAISSEHPVQI